LIFASSDAATDASPRLGDLEGCQHQVRDCRDSSPRTCRNGSIRLHSRLGIILAEPILDLQEAGLGQEGARWLPMVMLVLALALAGAAAAAIDVVQSPLVPLVGALQCPGILSGVCFPTPGYAFPDVTANPGGLSLSAASRV
jgi:hypothetical protein